MRFAVSLLMFICVASVIGTVLQQNDVANSYLDRFGPFWFALFDKFSIWHVYNSWWFLLIMAFLVVSTSLCVLRNTPRFIRDARSFREYVRGTSLRAFPHRIEVQAQATPGQTLERVQGILRSMGYRYRLRHDEDAVMVAAKKGSANRLGYIFAHVAIVVICVGGLLDSDLPQRLQVWFGGKQPITENMLISQVPESGRLPINNPSFRANMLVPEGGQSSHGIINDREGVLLQPLPFSIRLKRFIVDYYSTGMPSSFKSEVIVTDHETGESFEHLIEVNEPLHYRGVTVYQSSLDDGGSKIELVGYPLSGPSSRAFNLEGTVGQSSELLLGPDRRRRLELDLTELRIINVENLSGDLSPQPMALFDHVASVTGSAANRPNEGLTNVGPSVRYRLVGEDGQSSEFTNYMLPVELDGSLVYLAGVRRNASEPFRYLRIPVDEEHEVTEFMDLRAALANPQMVREASARFARLNAGDDLQEPLLQKAAQGALESFYRAGFGGIVSAVPDQERERVLEFAVPMIQLSLGQLRDIMRAETGREPLSHTGEQGQSAERWLQTALLALANLPDYPAPVLMTMSGFDHVQASVFQITRSPGKWTVYLGSLFLIIGVFAMFYIRDRRVWVWIRPADNEGSQVLAAMTSQRRNLDFNQEFQRFRKAFSREIT
ncbi:MAG: cytochrome c biogenesis protein ResB [Castellaniella sp.]